MWIMDGVHLVEEESIAPVGHWKILGTKLKTQFSNNIRNNFGFLNRAAPEGIDAPDIGRRAMNIAADMCVVRARAGWRSAAARRPRRRARYSRAAARASRGPQYTNKNFIELELAAGAAEAAPSKKEDKA